MPERWRSYDKFNGRSSHADYVAWARVQTAYLDEQVFLPIRDGTLPSSIDDSDPDRCPESFRYNPGFFPYDRDLDLIRVEEVRSFARAIRRGDDDVYRAADEWLKTPSAAIEWRDLLAERNRQVQIRPTFAALYEVMEDLLD